MNPNWSTDRKKLIYINPLMHLIVRKSAKNNNKRKKIWTIFVMRIAERRRPMRRVSVCLCVGCVIFEDFTKLNTRKAIRAHNIAVHDSQSILVILFISLLNWVGLILSIFSVALKSYKIYTAIGNSEFR